MPNAPLTDIQPVRNFIRTEIMYDDDKDFDADTNLIDRGIIDSMSLVRLISFIEEQYGIQVEDEAIVPENFSSLNKVAAFIASQSKA